MYAQGSADLPTTYRELQPQALAAGNSTGSVKVDYDMWYPFQWYVRNETQAAILQFDRFCTEDSEDETEDCRKVGEDTGPLVYLAEAGHEVTEETPAVYRKDGPMRNLLWYPETYRRPGENRQDTNYLGRNCPPMSGSSGILPSILPNGAKPLLSWSRDVRTATGTTPNTSSTPEMNKPRRPCLTAFRSGLRATALTACIYQLVVAPLSATPADSVRD